jgi:hypothetical protein
MRLYHRIAACALVLLFSAAYRQLASAQPTEAPTVDREAIHIVKVALMPIDGKRNIAVVTENRSRRPAWIYVSIDFNGPIRCGRGRLELGPKKAMWILCPVESIIARHEYPIRVEVYPDAETAESVETREEKARFRKSDVKWMESQL